MFLLFQISSFVPELVEVNFDVIRYRLTLSSMADLILLVSLAFFSYL